MTKKKMLKFYLLLAFLINNIWIWFLYSQISLIGYILLFYSSENRVRRVSLLFVTAQGLVPDDKDTLFLLTLRDTPVWESVPSHRSPDCRRIFVLILFSITMIMIDDDNHEKHTEVYLFFSSCVALLSLSSSVCFRRLH